MYFLLKIGIVQPAMLVYQRLISPECGNGAGRFWICPAAFLVVLSTVAFPCCPTPNWRFLGSGSGVPGYENERGLQV